MKLIKPPGRRTRAELQAYSRNVARIANTIAADAARERRLREEEEEAFKRATVEGLALVIALLIGLVAATAIAVWR